MFYVDIMGNLLSNLKLAFYEPGEDAGFFTRLFTSDNAKTVRDNLVKSYTIIQEIYDDILAPLRISQISDSEVEKSELERLKAINLAISKDKSLDELASPLYNLERYLKKELFFSAELSDRLKLSSFDMTDQEYR